MPCHFLEHCTRNWGKSTNCNQSSLSTLLLLLEVLNCFLLPLLLIVKWKMGPLHSFPGLSCPACPIWNKLWRFHLVHYWDLVSTFQCCLVTCPYCSWRVLRDFRPFYVIEFSVLKAGGLMGSDIDLFGNFVVFYKS